MATNNTYPLFQKGAVLRSSDLNNVVDSIIMDDNGIRQLIGYGIIEGLEIVVGKGNISISAGCAVAPNGDLLVLKEDRILDTKILDKGQGCLYINKVEDKIVNDNPKDDGDKDCGCDTQTIPFINLTRETVVDFGIGEKKPYENLEICIPGWCEIISGKTGFNYNHDKINWSNIKNNLFYNLVKSISDGYIKTASCFPACFPNEFFKNMNSSLVKLLDNWFIKEQEETSELICNLQYFYDYLKDLIAAQEEFLQYAHHIPRKENPDRVYIGELTMQTDNCMYTSCREIFCHFENEKKAKFYACRMMKLADVEVFGFPELPQEIFPVKELDDKPGIVAALKYERIRITPSAALSRPLSERAIPFYLKEELRPYWNYEKTAIHQQDFIPHFEELHENHLKCDLAKYDFFRVEGYSGMDLEEVVRKIVDLRSRLNIAFDIKIVVLNEKESYGLQTYYEDLQRQYAILRHQYLCQWEPKPGASNQILPIIPLLLANYNNHVTDCPSLAFELLKSDFNTRREDLIFDHYKQKHTGLEHFAGVPNGGTLVLCVVQQEVLDDDDVNKDDVNNSVVKAAVYNPKIKYTVIADFALPYRCCDSDGVVDCLMDKELEVEITFTNANSIEAKFSKGKTIYSEWRDSNNKPIEINSLRFSSAQVTPISFAAMSYCREISIPINDDPVVLLDVQENQINLSFIETFNNTKNNNKWIRLTDVVAKFEKALRADDISNLKGLDETLSENAKLFELFQPVKSSLSEKYKKKEEKELLNKINTKLKPKN